MRNRRLLFSDAAMADILEQADWYSAQSGQRLVLRWEKAVTRAVSSVFRHPATGTSCSLHSVELADVRRTSILGFPKHLLFYRFDDEEIIILRIVHGARDLERLLS